MTNYDEIMVCPSCGTRDLNLHNYSSLLVLKEKVGLFTLVCPSCNAKVSSIQPIPDDLDDSIANAAAMLSAGMGHTSS